MGVQINGDTGNISATKADYSGNVTIGGTLTYEDVTNIDSVGLVTARNGIEIGARPGVAASISVDGNMVVSGISTVGELISSYGTIVRNVNDNGLTIAGGNASNSGANVTVYGGSHGSYPDVVRFRIDGSEKARIDGSGRLLLGTTTEGAANADELTISFNNTGVGGGDQGRCGLTIRSGQNTSSVMQSGYIYFSDGTSGGNEYRGVVAYNHASDYMYFATAESERLRIESAGTVKVNQNLSVTGIATVGSAVTISESGIEASGIGITCANINGGQIGGRRNIVINGGMALDQRTNGTATTPAHTDYVLDRWENHLSQSSKFSVQRVSDAPEGVGKYSSKITSLSAYTVLANDYFAYNQNIEGSNIDYLQFGTSSAKTITVSFYVKSSLTGTFAFAIANSAYNRRQVQEYTISSANTWERKSLTFTGDTTGTWLTTNGVGMRLTWSLGGGSNYDSASPGTWLATDDFTTSNAVDVVSTNAATWYLTGCQLEVGTQTTPFEYRTIGEELQLCQRYYYVVADGRDTGTTLQLSNGYAYATNQFETIIHYPVMRAAPALAHYTGTQVYSAANAGATINFNSWNTYHPSERVMLLYQNSGLTASPVTGQSYRLQLANSNAYIHLDAEL